MTRGRSLAEAYDLLIFDLDGVVYVGDEAVPAAVAALNLLHTSRRSIVYATNNASRGPHEIAAALCGLGISATDDEIFTSAQATATVLATRLPVGSPVLVIGSHALADELSAVGLHPVRHASHGPVAVVQGFSMDIAWAHLAEGCMALRAGTPWIATNADRTLPSPRGPLPGNGSLVAALATASGREPDLVVGKPAPELLHQAAQRFNARRPLTIGDRLDTDIEGANRAGMDSLLVLTGVATPAELLTAPAHQRPTYLAADLSGLFTVDDATPIGKGSAAWHVERSGDRLALDGDGDPIGALRALCAAAWNSTDDGSVAVRPVGRAAETAVRQLGLVEATGEQDA